MKRECNISYCEVFYVFFRIKVELDLNNSSSTLEDYDMDDYEEGEELDKNVTKKAKYRYHLTFLSLSPTLAILSSIIYGQIHKAKCKYRMLHKILYPQQYNIVTLNQKF